MENFSYPSFLLHPPYLLNDKAHAVSLVLDKARNSYSVNAIYWITLLSLPFFLTYVFTYVSAVVAINSNATQKRVPTSPYWIPFLGHALDVLFATSKLFAAGRNSIARGQGPLAVRLGIQKLVVITGSENITQVFRAKELQAREVTLFALSVLFDIPKKSRGIYMSDKSGIGHVPHPGSDTPLKDRHFYQTRKIIVENLNGSGLENVSKRLQDALHIAISNLNIGQHWHEKSDLYTFVQDLFTAPAIESICGSELLRRNPDFVSRLMIFDRDTFWFIKCLPKFLIPSAWDNRRVLINAVKEWHQYANANYQESCVDAHGNDKYFGTALLRQRQEAFSKVDTWDADTLASTDLGLIWTLNGNSTPAIFWTLYELTRHPEALMACREEIASIESLEHIAAGKTIDTSVLCRNAVLQSVYAETLRLYTSILALRSPVFEDFRLGNWCIPRNQTMAIDSRPAHFDRNIWNSKLLPEHAANVSVHRFYPERFLRYPDEAVTDSSNGQHSGANSKKPYFSVKGLSGAWLPFGGGNRQCPGKAFAKTEIMVGIAILLSLFEIEILDPEPILPDEKYYTIGVLPPQRKVPFRMRRRHG